MELPAMIARWWPGRTRAADDDGTNDIQLRVPAYRATARNRGAWVLCRIEDDIAHFVTLSFWESREAVKAFAGDTIETAHYFPE
jgi:hypothetical protein